MTYTFQGKLCPLLEEIDLKNLSIARGTLNDTERQIMQNHVATTRDMLTKLNFPSYLKNVPEIASNHHEKLNGQGYPRQLQADKLSIQARILALADVYEALTAADRPYKKGKPLSECLALLKQMAAQHHIDKTLFNAFLKERVFEDYAQRYVDSQQIVSIDINDYLIKE